MLLVELRARVLRFGFGDADVAFRRGAPLEQRAGATQPVGGERFVGQRGQEQALGFDQVGRAQQGERLTGRHQLVGRDADLLDEAAHGSRDHLHLLRGDRDGPGNVRSELPASRWTRRVWMPAARMARSSMGRRTARCSAAAAGARPGTGATAETTAAIATMGNRLRSLDGEVIIDHASDRRVTGQVVPTSRDRRLISPEGPGPQTPDVVAVGDAPVEPQMGRPARRSRPPRPGGA